MVLWLELSGAVTDAGDYHRLHLTGLDGFGCKALSVN